VKRETFIALLSATLAEADDALILEAQHLLNWRWRTLREEKVQKFSPGEFIEYLAKDGTSRLRGTVDHLNRFSLTVRHPDSVAGYLNEVVPIERVLGLLQS
jgi:hypothetical protein